MQENFLVLRLRDFSREGASQMQAYDVVTIGAGHNRLVCAAYLLKSGYSVSLLEKNSIPGGGATYERD
jgi:phytoene dehydrogenase-like protein